MRKSVAAFAAFVVGSLCLSATAQPAKELHYASEKPLYAKVVLHEAGSKVLTLVFDESQGTGEGYNTVYADLNLNGDLSDDKPITGTLRAGGHWRRFFSFPPVEFVVRYDATGKGVEEPWRLAIEHYEELPRGEETETKVLCTLHPTLRVRDASGDWEYSFALGLLPRQRPKRAVAASIERKPVLRVEAKPNRGKGGNVQILPHLEADLVSIQCSKGGKSLTARVEMSDALGKVVRSEDIPLDSPGFGPVPQREYSVLIPAGRYRLEATVDTGPLAGVLKTTRTLVVGW